MYKSQPLRQDIIMIVVKKKSVAFPHTNTPHPVAEQRQLEDGGASSKLLLQNSYRILSSLLILNQGRDEKMQGKRCRGQVCSRSPIDMYCKPSEVKLIEIVKLTKWPPALASFRLFNSRMHQGVYSIAKKMFEAELSRRDVKKKTLITINMK